MQENMWKRKPHKKSKLKQPNTPIPNLKQNWRKKHSNNFIMNSIPLLGLITNRSKFNGMLSSNGNKF